MMARLGRQPRFLAIGIAGGAATLLLAAAPAPGTFDQEADAGEILYRANCAACHGADLTGKLGPPLRGGQLLVSQFPKKLTARDLAQWIQLNMPPGDPGGLSSRESLDLAAFIARTNGRYRNGPPFTEENGASIALR